MGHKCFISFKTEDAFYKKAIQEMPNIDMIDKSLNEAIDSDNEDYIMKKIREEYLADSTITIHLIGLKSAENLGWEEQKFIKRELQASLYDGENNSRNGILGIVLPSVHNAIYGVGGYCSCGESVGHVNLNDQTVIKEFGYNYYIPHNGCHHTEDQRYCVLVPWDNFKASPDFFINQAFAKRSHEIAKKVKVRPD